MEDMPCITPSVALHAFLRRAEIFLTFNRHQMMHSVFLILFCVKFVCKEFFLMQKHSVEKVSH